MDLKSLILLVSLAVVGSSGLTIAADFFHPPRAILIYIFKPLTTVLILAAALLPGTFPSDPYARAIAIGLVFSLLGDVFLMLPGNFFIPGLVSFLCAHLCYILAFLPGAVWYTFLPALVPLALIGVAVLGYLWPSLTPHLKPAVALYVAVIVTMAASAAGRAAAAPSLGALLAAAGSLLFMTSDAALAVNRFRRPFRWAQAVVLGTYYAAQLLIALSVGLAILPAA
jgi:uncharacterized membrane protein YhhN